MVSQDEVAHSSKPSTAEVELAGGFLMEGMRSCLKIQIVMGFNMIRVH